VTAGARMEGPSRWHRVSQLARLISGYPFDSTDFSDHGQPLLRIRDLTADEFETFVPRDKVPKWALVRNGDIVIGMDGDFNSLLWRRGEAAINQRVCVLRPYAGVDARFLAYALPRPLREINDLTWSTTVKHLSAGSVRAIRVPAHSATEQQAIADYLDGETAQIDAFIAKNEELIALLAERRAAAIAAAVTRGVDVQAKLRYTGLNWAEHVPAHWRVGNIRRFATMKTGHTPSRQQPEYWVDCDIPWFTLADVWQLREGRREMSETTEMISDVGLANSAAELLPAGTVALSRTASVGFAGVMATTMATSQDFWNWVPRDGLVSEYLWYHFQAMKSEFDRLMTGSTHRTIYQADAASLTILVPPVSEQHEIVAQLDTITKRIDNAVQLARRAVELARERRVALISAAVTGKIDVGVAA
jgi:type I restriction enzyme S subunit